MLHLYPSETINTLANNSYIKKVYTNIYEDKNEYIKISINRKRLLNDIILKKMFNKEVINEDELIDHIKTLIFNNKVNSEYTIHDLVKDCKIYYRKKPINTFINNYRSKERAGVVISKTIDGVKKYLIVKGNLGEGKWSFPKGHLDHPDERLEIGASRELYEETGVLVYPEFISRLPKKKVSRCTYFYLDSDFHKLDISDDLSVYNTSDTYEVETKEWKSLDEIKDLLINYDMKKYFGLNK